jgi:hypothetical protein
MAQSIKISNTEMEILRDESKTFGRSIAGQAEHWMRIGRAIEQSEHFNYRKIQAVLKGTLNPDHLNRDEQEVYLDDLISAMHEPQEALQQFLDQQQNSGLGVGLDDANQIISAKSGQK